MSIWLGTPTDIEERYRLYSSILLPGDRGTSCSDLTRTSKKALHEIKASHAEEGVLSREWLVSMDENGKYFHHVLFICLSRSSFLHALEGLSSLSPAGPSLPANWPTLLGPTYHTYNDLLVSENGYGCPAGNRYRKVGDSDKREPSFLAAQIPFYLQIRSDRVLVIAGTASGYRFRLLASIYL